MYVAVKTSFFKSGFISLRCPHYIEHFKHPNLVAFLLWCTVLVVVVYSTCQVLQRQYLANVVTMTPRDIVRDNNFFLSQALNRPKEVTTVCIKQCKAIWFRLLHFLYFFILGRRWVERQTGNLTGFIIL